MIERLSDFYVPWAVALAASSAEPAAPRTAAGAVVLHLPGLDLPLLQLILAVAGVLMARPLARKKEAGLPMSHFLVVTAIMLVVAVAWVAEHPSGVLFTFVIAIGIGFSGYSLIETLGTQVEAAIKAAIARIAESINFGAPK